MVKAISRIRLVGFWFAAVVVITASVVAMGVNVAVSTSVLLLTLSLVPPAIMLVVWDRDSSTTVAEILYSANTPKEGRS
jgi:hypothetical protein